MFCSELYECLGKHVPEIYSLIIGMEWGNHIVTIQSHIETAVFILLSVSALDS